MFMCSFLLCALLLSTIAPLKVPAELLLTLKFNTCFKTFYRIRSVIIQEYFVRIIL